MANIATTGDTADTEVQIMYVLSPVSCVVES